MGEARELIQNKEVDPAQVFMGRSVNVINPDNEEGVGLPIMQLNKKLQSILIEEILSFPKRSPPPAPGKAGISRKSKKSRKRSPPPPPAPLSSLKRSRGRTGGHAPSPPSPRSSLKRSRGRAKGYCTAYAPLPPGWTIAIKNGKWFKRSEKGKDYPYENPAHAL